MKIFDADLRGTNLVTGKIKIPANAEAVSSAASHTIDSDLNQYIVTAQAEATTFNAPTGSPSQGQKLIVRIRDNGGARTISWNAIFRAVGVELPTTTTPGKTTYLGFIYNSTDVKWDLVAAVTKA